MNLVLPNNLKMNLKVLINSGKEYLENLNHRIENLISEFMLNIYFRMELMKKGES